ncbi:hypothetical protein GOODEAATRI_002046 [Goodea atripinnis]|uniref:Uncharacterized protein n=1 Tax=Goodea atripinnis TaxID=208336 RepID=A0ABV0N770_9TELE
MPPALPSTGGPTLPNLVMLWPTAPPPCVCCHKARTTMGDTKRPIPNAPQCEIVNRNTYAILQEIASALSRCTAEFLPLQKLLPHAFTLPLWSFTASNDYPNNTQQHIRRTGGDEPQQAIKRSKHCLLYSSALQFFGCVCFNCNGSARERDFWFRSRFYEQAHVSPLTRIIP